GAGVGGRGSARGLGRCPFLTVSGCVHGGGWSCPPTAPFPMTPGGASRRGAVRAAPLVFSDPYGAVGLGGEEGIGIAPASPIFGLSSGPGHPILPGPCGTSCRGRTPRSRSGLGRRRGKRWSGGRRSTVIRRWG